jgi:hypothetical protein
MAKGSLLRQALARTRGVIQDTAHPGSPDPAREPDNSEAAGGGDAGTAHAIEFEPPALEQLFAALRRGERPGGVDGRPPDTGRTDQLLAELDRAWRAPWREARSGR